MKAPISRVLPTPVASAKQSDGKSRSKEVTEGNSERITASAATGSAVLLGGAISTARANLARASRCGGRRLSRPLIVLTSGFIRISWRPAGSAPAGARAAR